MSEGTSTDERLCAALVANLESGFEALVQAYQHRVYGFAFRLAGNVEDAEEISQDAFVRAYRALSTYTPPQTATLRLRPWLFQIALNVFRNRIRKPAGPRRQVPLDDSLDNNTADRLVAGEVDQPEQVAVSAEGQRLLARLITELPEHFRIAVVLRHIEGLSYTQMEALLGQPAGTLKSHVHRGVRQLRAALTAAMAEGPDLSTGSTRGNRCARSDRTAMSEVR